MRRGLWGIKGAPSSLHVSGSGCPRVLTGGWCALFSIVDAAYGCLVLREQANGTAERTPVARRIPLDDPPGAAAASSLALM